MASMHGRFATKDVICAGLTARPLSIEPLESRIDQRDIAIPPPRSPATHAAHIAFTQP